MSVNECTFSPVRRKRLEQQGNIGYTDDELRNYAFGFRFAYFMCGCLVFIGYLNNMLILMYIAGTIAFFASFLPFHPIDYFYNYIVRFIINKPKLPQRTDQGRFACKLATPWIFSIIYAHTTQMEITYSILVLTLLSSAFLVSIFDICIPSMIYNKIMDIDTDLKDDGIIKF